MSVLIVGDKSRLGKYLVPYLKSQGKDCVGASRRPGESDIFLDLNSRKTFNNIPSCIRSAVLLAGTTNYAECENNREQARRANVNGTIELLEYLENQSIYSIFVSTNTVLGDIDRSEQGEYRPFIEYSRQKVEVEEYVKSIRSKYIGILRLTKMVDRYTSPFDGWLEQLKKGGQIRAFDDLWMAPIRFQDACDTICQMLDKEYPDILHCSGSRDISYYEFACRLRELSKSKESDSILKTTSTEEGVRLLFNSRVTMLLLEQTQKILKVDPIECDEVIAELLKGF